MSQITLYSKPDCHLCDLAYALLHELNLDTTVINIQTNPTLMEQYHLLIPVVVFNDETELCWPFDASMIQSRLEPL